MNERLNGRPISGTSTEYGWCKAIPGGTGQTVVAISISRAPDMSNLQNALHKIQLSHPFLRSKLHFNATTSKVSFLTYPKPFTLLKSSSPSSTAAIVDQAENLHLSPLQIILEHELSMETWPNVNQQSGTREHDMFFATVYEVPGEMWVLVLRSYVLACDKTGAAALARELAVMCGGGEVEREGGNNGEVSLAIEDLIPDRKAKKPMWARGLNMIGYSMRSLSLTNLKFVDPRSSRRSEVVRIKMDVDQSQRLLAGCKSRGIKLCGALVAAGLIASHKSSNKTKKYGVVTMVDCRLLLEPPLSDSHFGFYHSAILNTHTLKGGERLWEVAEKCYTAFADDKKSHKQFSDMADLNFLMGKAIDNPSLTPSSSMRTSLLSVFEDTLVHVSDEKASGFEDCVLSMSIHGVGPSISIFDTVRDGRLDLVYVYPAPLHSRDQIQALVDEMKTLLAAAADNYH